MSTDHDESNLIKHDAIIQSDNRSLSHLDKKISNLLLYKAFEELDKKDIHEYSFGQLSDDLNWKSRNDVAIIESLDKLMSTKIKWNILGHDTHNDWTVSTIISSYRVIRMSGVFQYSYSAHFRQVLRFPEILSRIDINIQNKIQSKYTLNLWELLKTQFKNLSENNEVTTNFFPIEEFKSILGTTGDSYKEFKHFKSKIIIPAVEEINEVTDVTVKEVKYTKKGRSVTGIGFVLCLKEISKIQLSKNTVEMNELEEYLKKTEYNLIYHELKTWHLSDKNILKQFKNITIEDLQLNIRAASEYITRLNKPKTAQLITASFDKGWLPNQSSSTNPIDLNNTSKSKSNSLKKLNKNDDEYDFLFRKASESFDKLSAEMQKTIEDECVQNAGGSFYKDSAILRTVIIDYYMSKMRD